jgi:hypothetical protein
MIPWIDARSLVKGNTNDVDIAIELYLLQNSGLRPACVESFVSIFCVERQELFLEAEIQKYLRSDHGHSLLRFGF